MYQDEKKGADLRLLVNTSDSTKLCADCEDICALADIFNIVIRVITIRDNDLKKANLNYICPNKTNVKEGEIKKDLIPSNENKVMTLVHTFDKHFDLAYRESDIK